VIGDAEFLNHFYDYKYRCMALPMENHASLPKVS